MEPQIRFCTSADGTRIAYATVGEGPALVITPTSWESTSFVLEESVGGSFFQSLAQRYMVVRYDRRGIGVSERERVDFTLDADVKDLQAVVDHLGLARFALMGIFHLGPAVIAYTARHPERVSRLILYGTYARGQALTRDEVKASITSMVRSHWGIASRTLADFVAAGVEGDLLERIARDERESANGETVANLLEMAYETDVVELLPRIAAPTLVVHRRGDRAVPFRMARELASLLPDACLVTLVGVAHWPWFGDSDSVIQAIFEFLEQEQEPVKRQHVSAKEGPLTILFTDVEGSTALTQRLGDDKAREVLREHERITREALKAYGGAEVKTMGDGFMAWFSSATKALECAVAMQRAFAERNASLSAHPELVEGGAGAASSAPTEAIRVRIGLNAGEPIAEEAPDGRGDLFGTAVNLAARIAAQAKGGEILASDVVRQLVAGKGFTFVDHGEAVLHGFADPVRLYEVRWHSEPVEGQA